MEPCLLMWLLYETLPPHMTALWNPASHRYCFMEPCLLMWILYGTLPPHVTALWNSASYRYLFMEPCLLMWLLYGNLPPSVTRETRRKRTNITLVSIPVIYFYENSAYDTLPAQVFICWSKTLKFYLGSAIFWVIKNLFNQLKNAIKVHILTT